MFLYSHDYALDLKEQFRVCWSDCVPITQFGDIKRGRVMPDLSEVQSFMDASRQVNTARELETLIADVTREMGFDYLALIHHVDLSPLSADLAHMDQGDLIGLTNYQQEWVEI